MGNGKPGEGSPLISLIHLRRIKILSTFDCRQHGFELLSYLSFPVGWSHIVQFKKRWSGQDQRGEDNRGARQVWVYGKLIEAHITSIPTPGSGLRSISDL